MRPREKTCVPIRVILRFRELWYLQKQLRIFYILYATFLAVITYVFLLNEAIANVPTYLLSSSALLSIKLADFYCT